jgi:hypothetical protein
MAITGKHDSNGDVTLTWNSQVDKLPARNGGHYLPCEVCGTVQVVSWNTVSATCFKCIDFHSRQYDLDGREVEDNVDFMRQLDMDGDRPKALDLKVGESMNLGGGAAPLMVLRRVS